MLINYGGSLLKPHAGAFKTPNAKEIRWRIGKMMNNPLKKVDAKGSFSPLELKKIKKRSKIIYIS